MFGVTRLALGGHSFIPQLGTDPCPTEEEARGIVEACLDQGISWFDTTYQPERVALGEALQTLGRTDEARVMAWNFFDQFGPEDNVSGHRAWTGEGLIQALKELRRDRIDLLVVHPVDDPGLQQDQTELAMIWKEKGLVDLIGTWMPGSDVVNGPWDAEVWPYNVTCPENSGPLRRARARGRIAIATSPFVRGWELDARAENGSKEEEAASLLSFSLRGPVDLLVVSMRKREYVRQNLAVAGELGEEGPVLE